MKPPIAADLARGSWMNPDPGCLKGPRIRDLDAFAKATEEEIKTKAREVPNVLEWVLRTPGIIPQEPREQTWLEFGVWQGESLRKMAKAKRDQTTVWGFDAFRGLPEFWRKDPNVPGGELGKGFFGMPAIPHPPDGAGYVVGWFADTLRSVEFQSPIVLVHVDVDLYSSAKTVHKYLYGRRPVAGPYPEGLPELGVRWERRLTPGAVLVYDELLCPPWENGEMRALYEDTLELGMRFEWLAWQLDKVALRIL
jgi:hypothetical protein